MKPGRGLDALVAEKVMGLEAPAPWPENVKLNPSDALDAVVARGYAEAVLRFSEPKPYSTDIKAAWEVVERIWKLRDARFGHLEVSRDAVVGWYCRLAVSPGPCNPFVYQVADTAPHAICLAALEALGVEVTRQP
jgi:hypothetical protein